MKTQNSFIFISSPFRSGSALLSRTLNAHSQIGLINDALKYFRFCYRKYLPLNEKNVQTMLNDVSYRLLTRFNIQLDVQVCMDEIQKKPLNDTSIYSTLLNHLFDNHSGRYIGEMESVSWTKIPIFLNMLPDSKALLIVRDLRDVVVSFKKKTIAPGNDYLIALFNVIDAMDHYIEYQENFPSRFHGIRFESLKEHPEEEIRKTCDFLDLDFEPKMLDEESWLDFHGDKWKNREISSFHAVGDSTNPVGRWRKLITPEELYLCEWIGRKQMQAFGMRFEGGSASPEVINRAMKLINSSELLKNAFQRWKETGRGMEMYPLDPTDSRTWDKESMTI